jgi:hypothetical protein
MKESQLSNSTAELIRSLPTLPKERLLVLWRENFGKPAGSIRVELMIPILAFRIQERRPTVASTLRLQAGCAR